MGRELKRVPLDFEWPLDEIWKGFLMPESLHENECQECGGDGYSETARKLKDRWYGYVPFDPAETGSENLTTATPQVRAFAERNVKSAPEYYGTSEAAIVREAQRLADLWNGSWSHHLAQDDVDALVTAGRLMDFTHEWSKDHGWQPKDPAPNVSAAEVNLWSCSGFGHDGINSGVVIAAHCERLGVSPLCPACEGHGSVEQYPGQRADSEAWEREEPPTGEGWQVWETVSEGSPITPVFASGDQLVNHLVNVGAWDKKWNRDAAENFVKGSGWAPTGMTIGGQHYSPETMPADSEATL
jgi:hypothetical protein